MGVPLITVIGSLNIDLITRTKRVPQAGETLITQSYGTGCGGKGANQAVACVRLSRPSQKELRDASVDVKMIGAVGGDAFGAELTQSLSANGIDTNAVVIRKDEKTGVAVIIIEEDTGDNRILLSPNANYSLKPDQFDNLSSPLPDLIVMQLEIPLDTTIRILEVARKNKIEVVLNPAPAQVLPAEVYKAVTHLIVNESEAALITETKQPASGVSSTCIEKLATLGPRHIIVTLGSEGVLYLDTVEKALFKLDAEKVKVRDTTAAGDTFVGAYSVAVVKDKARDPEVMAKAVAWANRSAAITVQRDGAQSAIPWQTEVPSYADTARREAHKIEDWLKNR